jgi:hypothetical protein
MKDGDTFWYHECPQMAYPRYIPVGEKCPACAFAALPPIDKAKIRQSEYLNEIEGTE